MARRPPPAALVLGRVPYFASLGAAELGRLASRCRERTLSKGEVLFREGQPCRGLYVIADGAIEVGRTSVRGREQVLHAEGPGAALGEVPLFDGGGYLASAVALEPSRVLLVARADLVDLCRRRPAVALSLLEAMARRVRGFAGIVTDLAFRPVPERLARFIEAAAPRRPIVPGTEIPLGLTQAQLAARLGTVRELVARAFARLAADGVLVRRRGRAVIRDPARLARLARGATDGTM